jgi:FkbM family methyltransferase
MNGDIHVSGKETATGEGGVPVRYYLDFGGIKLPDITENPALMFGVMMPGVFMDDYFVHLYFGGNYDISIIRNLIPQMTEGPYGYTDGAFDVSVKSGDVVIDAGAWIGDFAAYAVAKGASAYAFEPTGALFEVVKETAALYPAGNFHPVKKAVGNAVGQAEFQLIDPSGFENTLEGGRGIKKGSITTETVSITTIDAFALENNLKIDFIKADIEGAERHMLKGAVHVLKTHAPKLAICTYHLPDDPEVLSKIIMDANPAYKIRHTNFKLYACVC